MVNFTFAQEILIYRYIRENIIYYASVDSEYFNDSTLSKLFELDKKFYHNYSKIPTYKQIYEYSLSLYKEHNPLTLEKLEPIFSRKLNDYTSDWLKTNTEAWIKAVNLFSGLRSAAEFAQTTSINPDNINETINAITSIISNKTSIDLDNDLGLDFFDPGSHEQILENRFTTGYSYIDKCLNGGYTKKELYCILGGTKKGKSVWLANLATKAVKSGKNVVYVSFELSDSKVVMRLGSNLLNIPMDEYEDISRDSPNIIKQKLAELSKADGESLKTPGELYVKEYGASTTSVPEMEAFLLNLQKVKGFVADLIVVDYVNIMKNWRNPNTEATYMKLKQIAEDLRAMAMRNVWAVLTVSQLNRQGMDASDVTTSDVSESTGLLHTVDACFAIIQDASMKLENFYYLKALLLRNSSDANSKKRFDISYNYLRISESDEEEINVDEQLYSNNNRPHTHTRPQTRSASSRSTSTDDVLNSNDFFN